MAWHGRQYRTAAEGARTRRRREAVARQERLHDEWQEGRGEKPAPVELFLRRGEYVAGVSA